MNLTIARKISIGYAAALVAMLVIGVTSYFSVKRFLSTADAVDHTYQVISALDNLTIDLINVETAERGYIITGNRAFLEPYNHALGEIDTNLQNLQNLTLDNPSEQQLLNGLQPLVQSRLDFAKNVIQLEQNGGHDAAVKLTQDGQGKRQMDEARNLIGKMEENARAVLKQRAGDSKFNGFITVVIVFAGVGIALGLLSLIGALIVTDISKPLQQLTIAANKIAEGSLNVSVGNVHRRDEIGILAQAFQRMTRTLQGMAQASAQIASGNLAVAIQPQSQDDALAIALIGMVESLSTLIGQVQRSGIQVNTSATEIAATAKQQQATAGQISATTTQIGSTSREIAATSRELEAAMKAVADAAEETATLAGGGQTGLSRMETIMRQIMDAAGSINARLSVLNEKASNINTVVTTITKVADQTNLLSLNAAIEAEKAGEYGRGFAVVATEIRRLADQTAVATYDIEQIVKEMQSAVSAGVMGMDRFSEEVRRGVDEVQQVGAQLSQIIRQVQAFTPSIETVNEGMLSQSIGAQQISEALAQLGEVAQQTAESLRQSNLSIDQLNEATRGLQAGVSRFTLKTQ